VPPGQTSVTLTAPAGVAGREDDPTGRRRRWVHHLIRLAARAALKNK